MTTRENATGHGGRRRREIPHAKRRQRAVPLATIASVPTSPVDADHAAFLLRVARLLLGGGLGARESEAEVIATGQALGHRDIQVAALPTGVFVTLTPNEPAYFSSARSFMRFDQLSEVLTVTGKVRAGTLSVTDALTTLDDAARRPPPWPLWAANLGAVPVGVGLIALLAPRWPNVVAAALGSVIMAVITTLAGRFKPVAELMPVIAGWVITAPILLAHQAGIMDYPFRTIVAILAIGFPGSVFVTGVADLVAGHSSAGTARLAAALMQFTLYITGLVLGVITVGGDLRQLLDLASPAWPFGIKLVGIVLATIGVMVFCYCPWRHTASIVALSTLAGAVQVLLGGWGSPALGGLIAALLASVGAQLLARTPKGPPWHVTYLPAFMVVAPGSFAFLTASQVSGYSASPIVTATSAFLGVAVGTLLGGSFKEMEFPRSLARGSRRRRT